MPSLFDYPRFLLVVLLLVLTWAGLNPTSQSSGGLFLVQQLLRSEDVVVVLGESVGLVADVLEEFSCWAGWRQF